MSEVIPVSVQEVLDERVFNFAQAAQKHFKTNDLVVFLDLSENRPELQAIPRARLAASLDVPAAVRTKVSKPASALAEIFGVPNQSFWFFVVFESGEGECVAVNASMLAPSGCA